MNAETGTMAVRYLFDNPDGQLVPGGYVNILLGSLQRPHGHPDSPAGTAA